MATFRIFWGKRTAVVIPPVVTPMVGGGGYLPNIEVARLSWGAIRAYPQVIFDLVYETPIRGIPDLVAAPAIAVMPVSDSERMRRFAEAAAAFDLDLVMKYLEAMGIEFDA